MKKFCDSLKEHAKYITDFEKKKMLLLTKKTNQNHTKMQKNVILVEKESKKILKI